MGRTGVYLAGALLEDEDERQGEQEGGGDHQKGIIERQNCRLLLDRAVQAAHRPRRGIRSRVAVRCQRCLCPVELVLHGGAATIDMIRQHRPVEILPVGQQCREPADADSSPISLGFKPPRLATVIGMNRKPSDRPHHSNGQKTSLVPVREVKCDSP